MSKNAKKKGPRRKSARKQIQNLHRQALRALKTLEDESQPERTPRRE
jgi:hypothetical protein